jgi:hypothetical protein
VVINETCAGAGPPQTNQLSGRAQINPDQAAAVSTTPLGTGTYGKIVEGFDVTDSLPIPRLIGVFAAVENMTFGALSVSDRPFHSTKPNDAGGPAFRDFSGGWGSWATQAGFWR